LLSIQAGIPPGVLNGFVGGVEAGAAMSSHMKIRKMSFTGSLATARHIQVAAARSNLKNVVLELGGRSIIVFPDANLGEAAQACSQYLTLNGQGYMLGTRVYLHEDIANEVLAQILKITDEYEDNLGSDPLAEGTWSSPLFHKAQKATVLKFIDAGKKEATLLGGGATFGDRGCYVKPTIFTNPSPNATVLQEEVFGPVVVVLTLKTEDEVLTAANDSEYGLGASLWESNLGRSLRFVRRLEAGSVGVNGTGWSPYTPFGGWKRKLFVLLE
jgi:aldehyde dehydrogenase (NAD+)